jgi:iron(III) transport system substrate-binding protein
MGLLTVAACSTGASAPASTPAAPPASWQAVVAAARSEGQVALITQSGTDISAALSDGFQKAFPDIRVELTAGNGSDVTNKMLTERAAGRFNTDLVVHGTTTVVATLLPARALDPLAPYLVGPDDADPAKWLGGKYNFADSAGQYDLIFTGGVHMPLIYNPARASAADFHSFRDLLDPKWKGKIAMFDPRGAGSGLSMMTLFYRNPTLGKDYIQQLLAQSSLPKTTAS